MKSVLILTGLLMLSACSLSPTEQFTVGGLDLIAKSPEKQLVVFATPDDTDIFCLAPPPDAVATRTEGLSLGRLAGSIGESDSVGAAVLGGRGQAALITRELLYRTCELSVNYRLTKEESLDLYHRTLHTIEKVAVNASIGSAPLSASVPVSPMMDEGQDSDDKIEEVDGDND
jgi:hypothetical protein